MRERKRLICSWVVVEVKYGAEDFYLNSTHASCFRFKAASNFSASKGWEPVAVMFQTAQTELEWASGGERGLLRWPVNTELFVCCIYATCVHTPVSPQCERFMCLEGSDLITPLTGLIHTQALVHIKKKGRKKSIKRGNPTNRELVVSVGLEANTFRVFGGPFLIFWLK